jgi:hypothetical protein
MLAGLATDANFKTGMSALGQESGPNRVLGWES